MSKKSALYNIVHFLFGYVVLYTTPMNLALEQAERGLPSNGVFTSVINKGLAYYYTVNSFHRCTTYKFLGVGG